MKTNLIHIMYSYFSPTIHSHKKVNMELQCIVTTFFCVNNLSLIKYYLQSVIIIIRLKVAILGSFMKNSFPIVQCYAFNKV